MAAMLLLSAGLHAQTVEYIHTDALGTPIAVTDANRVVIERSEYEPYGKLLNRPLTDGPGFTGHVQDAATGLTYMQQRYYDPMLGLFLSVDPVTAYSNPLGQFHRYRYANDNPYRFTDPDGRCAASRLNKVCEGLGMEGNSVESSRKGRVVSRKANDALTKSDSFRLYDSKETMYKRWSDIVTPIAQAEDVEAGSLTYRSGSQFTFGPVFSSGGTSIGSGIFSMPGLAGASLMGFIHNHLRGIGFSSNGLTLQGRGNWGCKSAKLNCDWGDLSTAQSKGIDAVVTYGNSINSWNNKRFRADWSAGKEVWLGDPKYVDQVR